MNPFFGAFAPSNAEAERVFGEEFTFNDRTYTAIGIDELSDETRAMMGGKFRNATDTMNVRNSVLVQAGVIESSIISIRGRRLRVIGFGDEGDDTRNVHLGPVQIAPPDL